MKNVYNLDSHCTNICQRIGQFKHFISVLMKINFGGKLAQLFDCFQHYAIASSVSILTYTRYKSWEFKTWSK